MANLLDAQLLGGSAAGSGETLSGETFRARLERFYRRADPPKLLNIDQIVNKHHHRQQALLKFLAKKYNVPLAEVLGTGAAANAMDAQPAASPPVDSSSSASSSASPPLPTTSPTNASLLLDFAGSYFDPVYALAHPVAARAALPAPRVRPLDNMSKCCVLLPASDPNYRAVKLVQTARSIVANAAADAERALRKKKWEDAAKTDIRSLRGLPDRLAAQFQRQDVRSSAGGYAGAVAVAAGLAQRSRTTSSNSGRSHDRRSKKHNKARNVSPLNMLERCFREKRRVRVFVGASVAEFSEEGSDDVMEGVQRRLGTVTGYLKAFDKHMNMILGDAEEDVDVCVGFDWVAREKDVVAAVEKAKKSGRGGASIVLSAKARRRLRKKPVWQRRQRQLHQSFLKGGAVVMVQVVGS